MRQLSRKARYNMGNVQLSKQYTHLPDPLSLEGLDDFLCGLIDELFQVEPPEARSDEEIDPLLELAKVEQDILDAITAEVESKEAVSGRPGLFFRTVAPGEQSYERPSIFEADREVTNTLNLKARLLESQLDYRNKELNESLRRIKWLETQLAEKDDQLKFLPELLKRSIEATSYEFELEDLKLKLEFLTSELAAANQTLDTLKSNWLGRLSLWIAKGDGGNDAA